MSRRIFISGPVSGLDYNQACAAFFKAEAMIRERGDTPVTPVRICSAEWPWKKCMRTCLKALADCDGIYMLHGWRKSRGAKLEHFNALKLGMTIETEK